MKQSPRQWNIKFNSCMKKLGFSMSSYDSCLYFKDVNSPCPLFVLLYVDDILLICKSGIKINDTKSSLKQNFDMKDLGPAQVILGMKILRARKKCQISLSQKDYLLKVLKRFKCLHAKPTSIPLGGHLDLTRSKMPLPKEEADLMSNIPYDAAVGSLMYAMICTRPDLAFAISVLSRYMSEPSEKHWIAMKYVLRYIAGTIDFGLVYGKHSSPSELFGFVDSDYASNKDTRKSTTAFQYTWAGNCVTWKTQQQTIVALSSTEAEYIAAVEASKEAIWLQGLLREVERKHYVSVLHLDSQSALYLCKDPMYHERTKHIDVRNHFIRDMIDKKVFLVTKIDGKLNPADFGTKIVSADKFDFCRSFLHIEDLKLT